MARAGKKRKGKGKKITFKVKDRQEMLSSFEDKDYDSLLTCAIDRLASGLHLQRYESRAAFQV